MTSRITYCKDIYYFQVFLLVPAKGLRISFMEPIRRGHVFCSFVHCYKHFIDIFIGRYTYDVIRGLFTGPECIYTEPMKILYLSICP